MLDFNKLVPQLNTITAETINKDLHSKIAAASDAFISASAEADRFEQRIETSRPLTFWPLFTLSEALGTHIRIQSMEQPHAVVAVDGSQIMPSHHEVYNCYLINIGKTCIAYGGAMKEPVRLESEPKLYHTSEDLYPLVDRRRVHVDEQFVALERSLMELTALAEMAEQAKQEAPLTVAFVDGSLMQWSFDQMPEGYQADFTLRLCRILDRFAKQCIPLLGYVSQSRSADIINGLRVWNCPYEVSDCARYCGRLHEEEYPCSTIWPCTDRQVMQDYLEPGERGALFVASNTRSAVMPEKHKVHATYLNVGHEVARIEFPKWLAQNPSALNEALSVALTQTKKGAGYPVCLAESHNLAVVRSSDRAKFFELIARHLMEIGVPRVRVSPKETGKRRGII